MRVKRRMGAFRKKRFIIVLSCVVLVVLCSYLISAVGSEEQCNKNCGPVCNDDGNVQEKSCELDDKVWLCVEGDIDYCDATCKDGACVPCDKDNHCKTVDDVEFKCETGECVVMLPVAETTCTDDAVCGANAACKCSTGGGGGGGGGGNSCFIAGTKITLADRSLKNIEDINAGDLILSYDAEEVEKTRYGRKYIVEGSFTGPSGRVIQVVTIWIILKGDSVPRFVTAYPGGAR